MQSDAIHGQTLENTADQERNTQRAPICWPGRQASKHHMCAFQLPAHNPGPEP